MDIKASIIKYTLTLSLFFSIVTLSSCDHWVGETVESSYILPPYPDPDYSFTRGGNSSVDYLECSLLKDPIDYIYRSYLKEANIQYYDNMSMMKGYFDNGEFGLKPRKELSSSPLHQADSARVLADVEEIFTTSGQLSGLGTTSPGITRATKAQPGQGGYLGRNVGDVNLAFANDKGLVIAEYFLGIIDGGIYLDKILNTHLNDSIMNDVALRQRHEQTRLVLGHNYTELEHHWDLAYGYYQYLLPYVQRLNSPALKDTRIKLYNAFATGRLALTEYRYADMVEPLKIIRTELSKVMAIRAINLLTGEITLVNMNEEVSNALVFLSQACGAIYALQFTARENGIPHLTYAETKSLISQLTSEGDGLWEQERLLGDETVQGSLRYVAKEIKIIYGLNY